MPVSCPTCPRPWPCLGPGSLLPQLRLCEPPSVFCTTQPSGSASPHRPHPHHPRRLHGPSCPQSWILFSSPPASWLQADRLGPPSSQHQSRPLEPLPESEAPAAPGEQVSPSALPPRPRASLALDPDPADVCPGGPCSQEPSRTPARPTRPSTPPAPTPPPVPHAQSLSWFLWLSLPFLTSRARRGHPSGPPSPKAPSCVVHCICLSLSHPRCPET